MTFWLHPVWQAAATLLSLHVLYLAWARVQCNHLGRKVAFAWKDHVRWGRWTIGLWMLGALLGIAVARLEWGAFFITGPHAWVGLAFLALALFGYLSGHVMDKVKKRRKALPIAHGIVNVALVAAALWQVWSGWPFLP